MQPLAAKTPVRGSVSNSRTANLTEIANANVASSTVPKMGKPTLTGGIKQISLSWSHPQGVTGLEAYRIRYKKKGTSTWTFADAKAKTGNQNFEGHLTSAAIPAYEDYTMKDDTTYQVEIRAGKWNGGYGGWCAWSDTVETKTLVPLKAPGKPEVIPFVVPNAGTYNTYFLVKWTLAGRNPTHDYQIDGGPGSGDDGYPTDQRKGSS